MSFLKAQLGAGVRLPANGTVFLSVNDRDKAKLLPIARRIAALDFKIVATRGTRDYLAGHGVPAEPMSKIQQGRPHILDAIKNSTIHLMLNTPAGGEAQADDARIRQAAIQYGLPYTTTMAGAAAAVSGIESLSRNPGVAICSLQEFHEKGLPQNK